MFKISPSVKVPSKRTGFLQKYLSLIITVLVIGTGVCVFGWLAFFSGKTAAPNKENLIKADKNLVTKVKPKDPGGMEIENMDKKVYDSFGSSEQNQNNKFEHILPAPEVPIDKDKLLEKSKQMQTAQLAQQQQAGSPTQNQPLQSTYSSIHPGMVPDELNLIDQEIEGKILESDQQNTPNSIQAAPANSADPSSLATYDNSLPPSIAQQQEEAARPMPTAYPPSPPPAAATIAPANNAATSSSYKLQLASFKSEDDAKAELKRLVLVNKNIFENLVVTIEKKSIPAKGFYYRIYVGDFATHQKAMSVCKKLSIKTCSIVNS